MCHNNSSTQTNVFRVLKLKHFTRSLQEQRLEIIYDEDELDLEKSENFFQSLRESLVNNDVELLEHIETQEQVRACVTSNLQNILLMLLLLYRLSMCAFRISSNFFCAINLHFPRKTWILCTKL